MPRKIAYLVPFHKQKLLQKKEQGLYKKGKLVEEQVFPGILSDSSLGTGGVKEGGLEQIGPSGQDYTQNHGENNGHSKDVPSFMIVIVSYRAGV